MDKRHFMPDILDNISHIKNKINVDIVNLLGEHQCGFKKGRGVTDLIFTLREIQAESYEYKNQVMFMNFQQACDNIRRRELLKALEIS